MNALGDLIEMVKRLAAVEVKVDHLSEKIETSNTVIENHVKKTEKNFEEMGKRYSQQEDTLKRIVLWMDTAPKLIKLFIAVVLAATVVSTNGWKMVFDIILNVLK